jgi:hypothetical protein
MALCWYDVVQPDARLPRRGGRAFLRDHAIHWFDDFCRKTRRFGVRVPRCPPVNAGPNATAPQTAEPPVRRAGAQPRPGRLTTHGEQTARTQDRSTGRPRWPRQAPTFAHVAA